MLDIGVPELIIVAVVLLLLFGPGKAADLGGALGRSVREFRKASTDDDASEPPVPSHAHYCGECGASLADAASFCGECGTRVGAAAGA